MGVNGRSMQINVIIFENYCYTKDWIKRKEYNIDKTLISKLTTKYKYHM